MAANFSDAAFARRITERLAQEAFRRVRAAIQSDTLRQALRLQQGRRGGQMWLGVPHYWAVFYHDGRRGFGPKRAQVLVWFKNPADDPRFSGGYPVRRSEIKRLTRSQFYNALRAGKLIVARRVGPARAQPFFRTGLRAFFQTGGSKMAMTTFRRTAREFAPDAYKIHRRKIAVHL